MVVPQWEPGTGPVARASSSDLGRAVMACEFPLLVWEGRTGVIRLANHAAGHLVGLPLDALIGRRVDDLVEHHDVAGAAAAVLRSGVVDSLGLHDDLMTADGGRVPVRAWVRAVEVDAQLGVVALVAPVSELPQLGRDPGAPWRDLAPVALGVADDDWRIVAVSREVAAILGSPAAEWVGASLSSLAHPDDRGKFEARRGGARAVGAWEARLRGHDGRWVEVEVLAAPSHHPPGTRGPTTVFALVAAPDRSQASGSERVAELEGRLRRIAAEVRAAGVLDAVDVVPSAMEFPQLAELSTRQWEILSRLLRGERVPTIAEALYLTPSTVRNHLASIFRKFGVHSQAALIQLLHEGVRAAN